MRGEREVLKKFKLRGGLVAVLLLTVLASPTALAAELPRELSPVGRAVGIAVKTDGLVVSELSEFNAGSGKVAPARDAGIAPGDVIKMIDGREITCAKDLTEALEDAGETVTVRISRSGEDRQVTVRPYRDENGAYLGVWVRDGLTGIGTVTYYDPETGRYGALGHSIADSATGEPVPLKEGSILKAQVTGVTKSRVGEPGQLGGSFDYKENLGDIEKNCLTGIFGVCKGLECDGCIPVARANEVRTGQAKVISDASGERREYDIEIVRLYSGGDGRDMMIKVTDPELIALTGGIVQGMSGSPIIQDGKLVGAVTHVLIKNPEKGYGIYIENMLREG